MTNSPNNYKQYKPCPRKVTVENKDLEDMRQLLVNDRQLLKYLETGYVITVHNKTKNIDIHFFYDEEDSIQHVFGKLNIDQIQFNHGGQPEKDTTEEDSLTLKDMIEIRKFEQQCITHIEYLYSDTVQDIFQQLKEAMVESGRYLTQIDINEIQHPDEIPSLLQAAIFVISIQTKDIRKLHSKIEKFEEAMVNNDVEIDERGNIVPKQFDEPIQTSKTDNPTTDNVSDGDSRKGIDDSPQV